MTKFNDGPAAGVTLMLKRNPKYLRVVRGIDPASKFDALDQPHDTPEPHEIIFAYEMAKQIGAAFIDGPKCRGCYPVSEYKLCANQPTDAQMRSQEQWVQWCEAQ